MAKSIDLGGGGQPQKKEPPKTAGNVPDPVSLPEGVSGKPPLPPGEVVVATSKSSLTDMEQQMLEKTGWKRGEPIPEDVQQQLAAVLAAEDKSEPSLQLDPATPPVELNTVDIEKLDPTEQARVRAEMAQMMKQDTETPDSGETVQVQVSKLPEVAQKVMSAKDVGSPDDEIDFENPGIDPELDQTHAPLSHCPHCYWDLSLPDDLEPTDADKLLFTHSVLGLKPFVKTYPVMDGLAEFTFRTLASKELDAIFAQVAKERDNNEIRTEMDYTERINRYRLYLQITKFQSGDKVEEFPDGFTSATNPNATAFWEFDASVAEPLKLIETHVLTQILKTESLNRVARQLCGNFNRLVSKMEALVDNADFWKGIAALQ